MNVLYILGNGFDKAQGMATSYPEFYEYLKGVQGSPLLEELKKDINADKKLWSDMEEAFGQFTEKIKSEDDFNQLYFELHDLLKNYLRKQDEMFNPTKEHKAKVITDFISIGKYLVEEDQLRYGRFMDLFGISPTINIRVMTFNYTNTLEKLFGIDSANHKEKSLGDFHYLHDIIHVHGRLDNDKAIIMGVDNATQIANEPFRENDNIKEILIKNQCNYSMGYVRSNDCERFINESDLIILYGVSLGETDSRWWRILGQQFKKNDSLHIIQFIYVHDAREQQTGRIKRYQKDVFMKKMGFKSKYDWPQNTRERLFFVVNSDAFKYRS